MEYEEGKGDGKMRAIPYLTKKRKRRKWHSYKKRRTLKKKKNLKGEKKKRWKNPRLGEQRKESPQAFRPLGSGEENVSKAKCQGDPGDLREPLG